MEEPIHSCKIHCSKVRTDCVPTKISTGLFRAITYTENLPEFVLPTYEQLRVEHLIFMTTHHK